MTLVDWRGDPVMPGAWLEGYKRVHPIHREPFEVGDTETRAKAARLAAALRDRSEDGWLWGRRSRGRRG